MLLRFFMLVSILFTASNADACRYQPRDFDTLLKETKLAFIGTMEANEAGLAIFHVTKGITGIEDRAEFTIEMGGSSCHHRFEAGQMWLFLGDTYPAGSMLLMDSYGRISEENAAFVKGKFGFDVHKTSSAVGGTLQNTCAPWDGAAFRVSLDNGVTATVYKKLEPFTPPAAVYDVGRDTQGMGDGSITFCRGEKKECAEYKGRVTFGDITDDTASGQIEMIDGEHHMRHVFRVKRSADQQTCG